MTDDSHLENALMVTQIVHFRVAPDCADRLIEGVAAEVEAWVRRQPGFISATFHKSLDGRHVFNVAMWRSGAALDAFARRPENRRIGDVIAGVGLAAPPEITRTRSVRHITPPAL